MSDGRISLLFGIPITEAEFLDRLAGADERATRSDYVAKFDAPDAPADARREHHERMWRGGYAAEVGAHGQRLAAAAEGFGVRVVRSARMADLIEAAGPGAELIVFSHWKGAEFVNDDFAADFDGVAAERLATLDAPLARWICQATQGGRGLASWLRRPIPLREALRRSLSATFAEDTRGADRVEEIDATRAARRRDELDACLSGVLSPGNRLELFDGLHSKEAVAAALGKQTKVIDLTVCTSTYLGDLIGWMSGLKMRTVQFIEVQEPVDAAARLIATLDLVSQGIDYLTARAAVAAEFERVVEETMAGRRRGET